MVAYGMGFEAYQDKYPLDENPFPRGQAEHSMWERGWRDAHLEEHPTGDIQEDT